MTAYVVRENASLVASNSGRYLARDSTGRLWCVYYLRDESDTAQIWVAYSDDWGVTWTHEQITATSPGYSQFATAIAVDSLDNIHIVWWGSGWGTYPSASNIQYRKRVGDSWQPQEAITDKDWAQSYPTMVIGSGNNVHICWRGSAWEDLTDGYGRIIYRRKLATFVGATWDIVLNVNDDLDIYEADTGYHSCTIPAGNYGGDALATAIQNALNAMHGIAPLNCGQEVMDYVKITDSRADDTRVGNIGFLNRWYTAYSKQPTRFGFEFRFGRLLLPGLAGTMPPRTIEGTTLSIEALRDALYSLWDYVDSLQSNQAAIISYLIEREWDMEVSKLSVTLRLQIPQGTDMYS